MAEGFSDSTATVVGTMGWTADGRKRDELLSAGNAELEGILFSDIRDDLAHSRLQQWRGPTIHGNEGKWSSEAYMPGASCGSIDPVDVG